MRRSSQRVNYDYVQPFIKAGIGSVEVGTVKTQRQIIIVVLYEINLIECQRIP
jgi:hypothetical protein